MIAAQTAQQSIITHIVHGTFIFLNNKFNFAGGKLYKTANLKNSPKMLI